MATGLKKYAERIHVNLQRQIRADRASRPCPCRQGPK